MARKVKLTRLLGYSDFFPDQPPEDRIVYAKQIGKELLYKLSCHFLSYFRLNAVPSNERLLQEWFTFNEHKFYNSPLYHEVAQRYNWLQNRFPDKHFHILSVESFLQLFSWIAKHDEIPDIIEKHDASATLPLFKLCLLFNEDLLNKFEIANKSVQQSGSDHELQRRMLAMAFPQHDFLNTDYAQLLLTQFYKCMKLLDFLDSNADYHELLKRFLDEFKCKTKEEFVERLSPAIFNSLTNKNPGWTILNVPENERFEENCAFLDRLALDQHDDTLYEQNDYLKLRSSPFQKIGSGKYRVIFDLFLIKKAYNGLYFELSALARKDRSLLKRDFLGSIRNEFSEGILVYDILNGIYCQRKAAAISGKEFKKAGLNIEPDFYVREENNAILFESKDFFIPGAIKLSYDFQKIEAELKKDRLDKAVRQLTTNIRRIIEKQLILDKDYDVNEINIYPVILMHDSLYSATALNYCVNKWLQNELTTLKSEMEGRGFDFSRIAPLTIIEIDTLILYQEQFKQGQFDLIRLIQSFHNHVAYSRTDFPSLEEIEIHAMQSGLPFSEFVRDYGYTIGIQLDMRSVLNMFRSYGFK